MSARQQASAVLPNRDWRPPTLATLWKRQCS